ncbi:MAG: 50S ribosomal protein L19 [Phycisphaerales bacterium]|nr:50S ribosomal protein L19 [Phycisphaerales bacterium]
MKNALLSHVESKHLKATPPQFSVGDLVDVHCRIVEGDKERIQVFSGTVISRKGEGINSTFTVRRIVNNEGVERIFPVHSPKIEKLEVKRQSKVRRAKLYYLRELSGKATRLKEGAPIIPSDTPATAEAKAKAKAQAAQPTGA